MQNAGTGVADGMTAADLAAAHASGQAPAIMDIGAGATREMARSGPNASLGAKTALEDTVNTRFKTQTQRTADFIQISFRPRPMLIAARRPLMRLRVPRISRLIRKHILRAIVKYETPELERLTGAPYVQRALSAAQTKWKNYAIHDGFGAPKPPFCASRTAVLSDKAARGCPSIPIFKCGIMPLVICRTWHGRPRAVASRVGC